MSTRGPRNVERTRWIVWERRRTVDILTRRGESAATISRHLGITPRTVLRYRAQIRQRQAT